MSGGGGAVPAADHDARASTVAGGISVLGTDGKRYVVDESTTEYFHEIEALVATDPATPEAVEERQILAGNALEEAVGHEMALSMDARCSRVMEKLLASCSDADLVRYLGGITSAPADFFTLCKSLFGSRVAEHALPVRRVARGRAPTMISSRPWRPRSRPSRTPSSPPRWTPRTTRASPPSRASS